MNVRDAYQRAKKEAEEERKYEVRGLDYKFEGEGSRSRVSGS
jgi:hypothetical protein